MGNDMLMFEEDHICDGCAQLQSECLCGIDLAEVLDCASPFHPGCQYCAVPDPPVRTGEA